MRKFISAATSLCMAATMVGAVVPAVAGAADATKGFAIRPYKDADFQSGVTVSGSKITVSEDAIKAGSVKIPVGVYLLSESNDLMSMGCAVKLVSNTASAGDVKFDYIDGSNEYFAEEKSFTLAGGTVAKSTAPITWAGEWSKRGGWTQAGTYTPNVATSMKTGGADYAYASLQWTCGGAKFNFAGEKSDDFPIYIVDVTLPQNAAAGDYVIDFCQFNTAKTADNPNPKNVNSSCMIQTTDTYQNLEGSGLNNLITNEKVTITVAGAATGTTSTASTTKPVTTTTTSTTKPVTPPAGDADFVLDFTNPESSDGKWHVKPGEDAEVTLYISSTGKAVVGFSLAVESKAKLTDIIKKAVAFNNASIYADVAKGECNATLADKTTGAGFTAKNGDFIYYTFSTDGLAPGEYPITLTKSTVLESSNPTKEYSVKTIAGTIVVDGEGGTTTTASTTKPTTTSTSTTTTPVKPPVGDADFTLDFTNPESADGAWHVKKGEDAEVTLYINSTGKEVVGFSLAVDSKAKLTDIIKKAVAFNNASIYADVSKGECNATLADKTTGAGFKAKNGDFIYYTFSTEGLEPGEYPITLTKSTILESSNPTKEYSVNVISGKIIVDGEGTTSTTQTTKTTTTTSTSTTVTTSTTKPVQPGEPNYGDVNCDGVVNIADVVLLNKWLHDSKSYNMTEQGKLNADCYNPQNGKDITADDSDAIIKSIVHLVTLPVKK